MERNRIYCIVEGHGEVNAIPILVRRLLHTKQCWHLQPTPAKKVWRMRSSGDFFTQGKLEDVLRAHKNFNDCAATLILVDMDEACPVKQVCPIVERIRQMESLPFSVIIVGPKPEYEAWFLASLESIHPQRVFSGDPESGRDAKSWLKREFGYKESQDQTIYTERIDLKMAQRRSRSFTRLYDAIDEIITASEINRPIITPAKC